jgi:hypothetical protein
MPNPSASKLIDDYIAKAQPFAQEICTKLRRIIFKAEPHIIEDWKWGPNYSKNGMVCGYGVAKAHVTFTFFQGALMKDAKKIFNYGDANRHNRSVKFTNVKEMNEKVLTAYIQEAVKLNGKGLKAPDRVIEVPADLKKALAKNKKALATFENFAFTHRKEYVQWVTGAKKQETRDRRIAKAVEMITAGKKYS